VDVMITGASGFLGSEIVKKINGNSEYSCHCFGFRNKPKYNGITADLSDFDQINNHLNKIKPDIIIHAAALTDVDLCEKNLTKAYNLNVLITKNLVKWCLLQKKNIRFIYISTDQVYNGVGRLDVENSVSPINFYGMSKLWSEDIVSKLKNHLIIRTNFFGVSGGLVKWILDANYNSDSVTLVKDVKFNPIYIGYFLDIFVEMLTSSKKGVFNLASSGAGITKADFLDEVIDKFQLNSVKKNYGCMRNIDNLYAKRPLDMRISVQKIEQEFGILIPTTSQGIDKMFLDFIA